MTFFDAAGLGLFCVTGALKALEYGLGPVPAALMGMVTGIGGGIARDLLSGRVPAVFGSELYATPALAGATYAVLAEQASLGIWLVAVPGVAICFGWRLLALRRNWRAPAARAVGQRLAPVDRTARTSCVPVAERPERMTSPTHGADEPNTSSSLLSMKSQPEKLPGQTDQVHLAVLHRVADELHRVGRARAPGAAS